MNINYEIDKFDCSGLKPKEIDKFREMEKKLKKEIDKDFKLIIILLRSMDLENPEKMNLFLEEYGSFVIKYLSIIVKLSPKHNNKKPAHKQFLQRDWDNLILEKFCQSSQSVFVLVRNKYGFNQYLKFKEMVVEYLGGYNDHYQKIYNDYCRFNAEEVSRLEMLRYEADIEIEKIQQNTLYKIEALCKKHPSMSLDEIMPFFFKIDDNLESYIDNMDKVMEVLDKTYKEAGQYFDDEGLLDKWIDNIVKENDVESCIKVMMKINKLRQ